MFPIQSIVFNISLKPAEFKIRTETSSSILSLFWIKSAEDSRVVKKIIASRRSLPRDIFDSFSKQSSDSCVSITSGPIDLSDFTSLSDGNSSFTLYHSSMVKVLNLSCRRISQTSSILIPLDRNLARQMQILFDRANSIYFAAILGFFVCCSSIEGLVSFLLKRFLRIS